MQRPYCGFKNRLLALSICACGLLAFCTTLSADSTVFVLGNDPSQNYTPAGQGGTGGTVAVGPYPGTLTNLGTTSSITLFFCLNGNLTANWDTTYNNASATEAPPSGQAQEEAAFLASLMLYRAAQAGITLTTSVVGGYESLTQTATGSTSVATFVSTVEGPISMAIWQIMGSLPTQDGITNNDPAAAPFVAQAQVAWADLLQYSSNGLVQDFNNHVMIFVPGTSNQSFVTAYSDPALMVAHLPEPGTVVLFGTGAVLIALGCTRRPARRGSARNRG
jgi:hypothetical protein